MNKELIDQFIVLQKYFRAQGDKGRSIAYSNAISALRTFGKPITNISQLKGVRGIGPKVLAKIKEYLETGTIETVEKTKEKTLREKISGKKLTKKEKILYDFKTIWGIGPKKAQKLYDLGIKSISQLEKHKSEYLTKQQKIGLKYREDLQKKVPRNIITSINVIMIYFLQKKFGRDTFYLKVAGSYRRGAVESGDIDCLISSTYFNLVDVVDELIKSNVISDVLSIRTEKFMGIAHCPGNGEYFRLDIEFVPENAIGTALLYFTGSKEFNVYMRMIAKKNGFLLNEHGLYNINTKKKVLNSPSEKDVFHTIGMPYVPPERR